MLNVLEAVSGSQLDGEFRNAVAHAIYQFDRIQSWLNYKAASQAPQALLVPAPKENGHWPWETESLAAEKVKQLGGQVVDGMASIIKSVSGRFK